MNSPQQIDAESEFSDDNKFRLVCITNYYNENAVIREYFVGYPFDFDFVLCDKNKV